MTTEGFAGTPPTPGAFSRLTAAQCEHLHEAALLALEPRNVSFGPGSDCIYCFDHRTASRRRAVLQDVADTARLVDALLSATRRRPHAPRMRPARRGHLCATVRETQ